jgi:hypothetical protein
MFCGFMRVVPRSLMRVMVRDVMMMGFYPHEARLLGGCGCEQTEAREQQDKRKQTTHKSSA